MTVLAADPPRLDGTLNFSSVSGDTLYVPTESVDDYQNSAWGGAFDNIVGFVSGTAGPLSWILTLDGTLTISGSGAMSDYSIPWSSHVASIEKVVVGSGVTTIAMDAFRNCTSLESVTIPESVTSIGSRAFNGCSKLTSIIIPGKVTTIGEEVFSGCTYLTSVTIPEKVTSIGYSAFFGCTALASVTVLAADPPRLDGTLNFSSVSGDTLYVPTESVDDYQGDQAWAAAFNTITAMVSTAQSGSGSPLRRE